MRAVHSMTYQFPLFTGSHFRIDNTIDDIQSFSHIRSYNLHLKAKDEPRVLLLIHNVEFELIAGPPRERDCRDLQRAMTGEKRRKRKKTGVLDTYRCVWPFAEHPGAIRRNCIRNFNIAHIIFQP